MLLGRNVGNGGWTTSSSKISHVVAWDVPKDVPGAPASRPIDRQFIASVDAA